MLRASYIEQKSTHNLQLRFELSDTGEQLLTALASSPNDGCSTSLYRSGRWSAQCPQREIGSKVGL